MVGIAPGRPWTLHSMSDLKLSVDRLSDTPQRFDFEVPASWWSARADGGERLEEGRIDRPLRFGLKASRAGSAIVLEGDFEGGLSTECSRCTRRYAHALRETFRLVLEPWNDGMRDGARAAIDPEGERALARCGLCLGEDLEAGWYRGPILLLDDYFAEVVALAIPIQPLCEEDCPGLCPHCGMERRRGVVADAPTAVCRCADERVESPFAVLARLKERAEPQSAGSDAVQRGRSERSDRGSSGAKRRSQGN